MNEKIQDVLLDSNAYFRFALSIHPLLKELFGESPQYSLHVLAELDDEYNTSTRLRHKFEWVRNSEYRQDRQAKRYELRGMARSEALNAASFLVSYADSRQLNLSREDLKALAVGFVKQVPVVTDDRAMQEVAKAHSIECWNSVMLLKVMVTAGRIDMDKVTEMLEYLDYENDLPMSKNKLRKIFKEYFETECPI
ncbi:MAG: hypothetical protein PHV34_25045 [Verrucomicrobiae bacterium]|nr:hypothetical protein [Verrucomicrobiae bacterium]